MGYFVREDYLIEFIELNRLPQAKVKDLRHQTTKTSVILGITHRSFSRLMLMPETFTRRYFQLHEPTLTLSYIGLSGGGSCVSSSKGKVIKTNHKRPIRTHTFHLDDSESVRSQIVLEQDEDTAVRDYYSNEISSQDLTKRNAKIHETNYKKAVKIAECISVSMDSGCVNMTLVRKLAKMSPYTCSNPNAISEILLVNLNSNSFWALSGDRHKRCAIATIIRRWLMVGIMKNPERVFFTEASSQRHLKILENVNDRFSQYLDDPELCMEIEVAVIIRLVSRAEDTITWWSNFVNELTDIAQGLIGLKNVNPVPLVATIFSYCNRAARVLNRSSIGLMNDLELLEQMFEISNVECKDQLQEYLANRFAKVSEMEWEQVHILLNYVVHSIERNKLEFSFITEVVKFQELMNHESWEIREGCATSLRQLQGNPNLEINTWARKITSKMIENEKKRDDKDRGLINILMLSPIESIEVSDIEFNEPISNIHGNEIVIGRDIMIGAINLIFSEVNILTLAGIGGIGKTSIALEYSQRCKNLYSIVHQINCETNESMKNGMCQLAKKLGLYNDIQEFLFNKLIRKLKAYQHSMLIILDNVGLHTPIYNIYVTNPRVKFLATSRSQKTQKTLLISPLSPEDSRKILQEKFYLPGEIEELDKLAKMLEGWPLALVQSAKIILKKNCTIPEFIKTIENTLLEDNKIKEALPDIFSNISSPTRYILKVLSICGSEKIPESMIKAVFRCKEYSDAEWLASKTSLLDSYIISSKDRYWKINKIIHRYIKENYELKSTNYKILIDYYCKNLSITNSIWLKRNRINRIRHLVSHAKILLYRREIKTSKEFMLLFNLIHFYIEIEINPSLGANYLQQVQSRVISGKFTSEFLSDISKQLDILYTSNFMTEASEVYYLRALDILKKILPKGHQDITDVYSCLGFLRCLNNKANESELYYFKALDILPSTDCSDKILKEAIIFVGLGNLKRENHECLMSEKYYLKALKLMKEILKPNHPEFVDLNANLGKLYIHEGSFKHAKEYYKQALDIIKQISPEKYSDVEELHKLLSMLSDTAGDKLESEFNDKSPLNCNLISNDNSSKRSLKRPAPCHSKRIVIKIDN